MGKFESDIIFHDTIHQKTEKANLMQFLYIGLALIVLLDILWFSIGIYTKNHLIVFSTLVILLGMICVFKFLKINKLNWASHLLLIATLFWILFIVIVLQGNHKTHPISVHHWLLAYVVVMQFVLIYDKKLIVFIYFLIGLSIFVIFEFRIIKFLPILVNPKADVISHLITPICILGIIIVANILIVNRLFRAEKYLLKTNQQMDVLLKNLLPDEIAKKVFRDGKTFAEAFSECSILFVKVIGLEQFYGSDDSEKTIKKLEEIFSKFDEKAEHHQVQRIKTIGDIYMVAAGAPVVMENHAIKITQFALELREEMDHYPDLDIRIGVNSGPVVAGLIGKTGLIYDLWGNTVNVASRMESAGIIGEIQISEATRELLGGRFLVEERGKIDVKGKGPLTTFLVKGYKSIVKEMI